MSTICVVNKCHALALAPELLAMIFREVIALHERRPILMLPTTGLHPENEMDTRPLLILTHVCRYWRDVALKTPALWTRVHGRCHDQMNIFLYRSRPLPITLFLDGRHGGRGWDTPLPNRMVAIVRLHARRLRRLDLSVLPSRDHIFPVLASLKAPQLECLTITTPSPGDSSLELVSWTPLLDGETSSLRALGIFPVVDWLPSSTFPNLTHLVLYFDPEMEELFHPFDLLRLLSNTPALEFLHVDRLPCEEEYMGNWHLPSEPIPLPHLRSLLLTDCPYQSLSIVLYHLSLPEDVFIRLQDINPIGSPPDPLPPLSIRPVTSLDVVMQSEQLLMVADGPTSGLWLSAQRYLFGVEEAQEWGDWLLSLHQSLTLTHVTHLHIYLAGWETFFPAFLAHLPQITHLSALFGESNDEPNFVTGTRDCATTTLCTALGQETPVLCPVLDTLKIEWPHDMTYQDLVGLPLIPAMLDARSHAGHPIPHVVVQVPAGPSFDQVQGLNLELHELIGTGCPPGTEYEVVEKADAGQKGVCAFEMRDGWEVDGEDRYWEVGEHEKPHYDLSQLLDEDMDY